MAKDHPFIQWLRDTFGADPVVVITEADVPAPIVSVIKPKKKSAK